ncbi:hypothetical protein SteCoe_21690 [Stentor coeruleus]|uniref:Phosphonopyruvate decarboxylase n=1 Tax=Stentor coeruleus TaxID=5963 RepID=A0A1R2BP21_9CILI|nr:hypothetical protein SteCoe_21690 [Stentor coeruleus]
MFLSRIKSLHPLRRFVRFETSPMDETERDFLPPNVFYNQLIERGFDFFTGLPDSLLTDFIKYISDNHPPSKYIIGANEGTAISIAAGWHLATRRYPVVIMQNSGVGNIVNPILSLADPKVYKIPMLLLIGWRGEPGKKDEPQHKVQGEIITSLLADIGITNEVLPNYEEGAAAALDLAHFHLRTKNSPYAFLVRRKTFLTYESNKNTLQKYQLSREEALEILLNSVGKFDSVVSGAGLSSRELMELREKRGLLWNQDFYCLGAKGHASSIAMGIALAKPSKMVYILDGDGSFFMHMGACAQIGARKIGNLRHIIFNNEVHESAGGAPSVGDVVDFVKVAQGCGYAYAATASTKEEIVEHLEKMKDINGSGLLEIKIRSFTRKNLKPLRIDPKDNKDQFMNFLDQ